MTKYQIENFKKWLEVAPFSIKNLGNWNHWLYYPETLFIGVTQGTAEETEDGSNKYHIKAIRQWMKEVDEGSFTSPLLNELVQLEKQVSQLTEELTTERETTQQALQTSQEWHERQKAEIIEQWKQKLQSYLTSRKQILQQEIQLIREVLHD